MIIDVHVHLAGVGTQGSGCWIAPRTRARPTFRLLQWWYGIGERHLEGAFDQEWAERVAAHVRESALDRAVVLGFDGAYDERGALDQGRSQMVIPPSWVLEVCRRHPDALLPGPSINPFRRDAMDRLEECIEGGAVLLKWLPSAQGIDPASPRLGPFFRRMAEARLPLLIHSGGAEMTFEEIAPALSDLRLIEAPLEAGVPVICAHMGSPVLYARNPNQIPLLREYLRRYPHLWVDNSGMANPSRFPHLARLADDPAFAGRTLHGSDFPVPSSPVYYPRRLGPARVWRIQRVANPLERDLRLKLALGYGADTLSRAADVLPHLDRWGGG